MNFVINFAQVQDLSLDLLACNLKTYHCAMAVPLAKESTVLNIFLFLPDYWQTISEICLASILFSKANNAEVI